MIRKFTVNHLIFFINSLAIEYLNRNIFRFFYLECFFLSFFWLLSVWVFRFQAIPHLLSGSETEIRFSYFRDFSLPFRTLDPALILSILLIVYGIFWDFIWFSCIHHIVFFIRWTRVGPSLKIPLLRVYQRWKFENPSLSDVLLLKPSWSWVQFKMFNEKSALAFNGKLCTAIHSQINSIQSS